MIHPAGPSKKNHFLFYILVFVALHMANLSLAQVNISGAVHIAEGGTMHVDLPETTFHNGMVTTDRSENYGLLSFGSNSKAIGADHNTHVNGYVRMHASNGFSFPVGHDAILQPVHIDHLGAANAVDVAYNHVAHTNLKAETGIATVGDEFYWNLIGDGDASVAVSWNAFSNIDRLTDNDLERLTLVGYDGSLWRVIESEVEPSAFDTQSAPSVLAGSIRSKNPVNLSGYEALGLASKDTGPNVLNISQGFTPNGDGINDTWHIENIDNYPNAKITVYSRWGREVFLSNGNYTNNWNGTYNGGPLPDAAYLYIIDLENDGKADLRGWIYIKCSCCPTVPFHSLRKPMWAAEPKKGG